MGICMSRERKDKVGLGEGTYTCIGRGVSVLHNVTS
jgi:hypothetical protein